MKFVKKILHFILIWFFVRTFVRIFVVVLGVPNCSRSSDIT